MNEREMKKENWPLTLLLVLLENSFQQQFEVFLDV